MHKACAWVWLGLIIHRICFSAIKFLLEKRLSAMMKILLDWVMA